MIWADLIWTRCTGPDTWIAVVPGAYLVLIRYAGRGRRLIAQSNDGKRRVEVEVDP